MEIKIVENSISKSELEALAKGQFGDFVKAVVDIEKSIMAIGGELHADEEKVLLEQGSNQEDLWGVNFRFKADEDECIEFNSMINIRPSQGNRSRGVESEDVRKKIKMVVKVLVCE